jgi:hypothetical protein
LIGERKMLAIAKGILPCEMQDSGMVVRTRRMPIVSEVVIGGKKMLSSARTARMKLVKNDTGTIANGAWTLNYL